MYSRLVLAVVLVIALVRTGWSQAPAAGDATLAVGGSVARALTLAVAELKTMPRTTVTVTQEGRSATYEGVALSEILRRAGAPQGQALSGAALALAVLATGADGYRAVFALADADPTLTVGDLLVADTMDGRPLADTAGPLRLVAPHDARPARSVRQLVRLDVVAVER
jgi:DMSO/TMAO reductase YedYZ molybdopterin-dependent catalytic subunit